MESNLEIPEVLRGQLTVDLWPTAAGVLGIGRQAAYDAARKGVIPTIRFGRLIRVPVPKLLELVGLPEDEYRPVA